MEEYNFVESLRPKTDVNVTKKRNSTPRNTRIPFELDVSFPKAFKRELTLMRIKFPFLTELQVQGRTLDKFCIPNLMGKPYKKNKSGNITMCTVQYAIESATKSTSERKFCSSRKNVETRRRHTIGGSFFPLDISFNNIYTRRNSKASKNLFNTYTLYSDEMDTDDYSIRDSSTDDSGLEDFAPENQSHSFELHLMEKPSAGRKPVKTYGKRKHPTPGRHGISRKANESNGKKNLKNASNNVEPRNKKSLEVVERKVTRDRFEANTNYINKITKPLKSIGISDYEGDTVGSSVSILYETPSTDERQIMHHESSQHRKNLNNTSNTVEPRNKKSLGVLQGKVSSDMVEIHENRINKITEPPKTVTSDYEVDAVVSSVGIIDETSSADEGLLIHHESSQRKKNLKKANNSVKTRNKKSFEVLEGKVSSKKFETNENGINKIINPPKSVTSDYEGDTVGSSVGIINETPPTDERQMMHHECSQFKKNLEKASNSVKRRNKKSSGVLEDKVSIDRFEANGINKIIEPRRSSVTSDYEGDSMESLVGIIDKTSTVEKQMQHESSQQSSNFTHISEAIGIRRKIPDFMSSDLKLTNRGEKISTSHLPLRKRTHSHDRRIKQSISVVSEEYMGNFLEHNSGSISDSMEWNSAYSCGVKCMPTSKPNVPPLKVNLSVCSEDTTEDSAKKQLSALCSGVTTRKYRKCSESVPYIDEALQNAISENDIESDESPMSEMEEEGDEPFGTPSSYRARKTSCSSIDSYPMQHHGRFSPYIIHIRSSQGTASESSDGENNIGIPSPQDHAINENFGILRGNFSPPAANNQCMPRNNIYTSPTSQSSQEINQIYQGMAQIMSQVERRTDDSEQNNDGYFLANLFDDYASQSMRRTLRSSTGPETSSQEDDGALVVE